MPGDAHIFFTVAMPACGSLIIDEAMAAPAIVALATDIVVLVVGLMAADDMVLAVATTICATAEEVEVVLVTTPFNPGMLAISIFAVFPLHSLNRHGGSDYQNCSQTLVPLQESHRTKIELLQYAAHW